MANADEQTLSAVRGGRVGVVFQEPMTAFNPVYTIGWQIAEAIQMHREMTESRPGPGWWSCWSWSTCPIPAARIDYYPHQLSGGQRQRAMIAQALACDPALLIADEPTTALDVTVQGEILDLIRDLRGRVNAAILLITHDMGVVADLADRIMVHEGRRGRRIRARRNAVRQPHPPVHPLAAERPSRTWAPAGFRCRSPSR